MMSTQTASPHQAMASTIPRILTPTPPASPSQAQDDDQKPDLGERGRKRRRSSATNQASQLPSTTLRGRGRRRSSSLHPIPAEPSNSQEPLVRSPHATTPAVDRHRSKSPDRRLSHGEKALGEASRFRAGVLKQGLRPEEPPSHKKRRSQSPSRSRSAGHEGVVKLRRRQRTRSRSRSHGNGTDDRAEDLSRLVDEDDDNNDEIAVED